MHLACSRDSLGSLTMPDEVVTTAVYSGMSLSLQAVKVMVNFIDSVLIKTIAVPSSAKKPKTM